MNVPKFEPTHEVVKRTPGEFCFFKGQLLQHVSESYYKDKAGNIGYVEDNYLRPLL